MAAQTVLAQAIPARGALTVQRSSVARSFIGTPLVQKSLVSSDDAVARSQRLQTQHRRWDVGPGCKGAGALQVTKASQRFAVRASATESSVDVEAIVKDLQEKVGGAILRQLPTESNTPTAGGGTPSRRCLPQLPSA